MMGTVLRHILKQFLPKLDHFGTSSGPISGPGDKKFRCLDRKCPKLNECWRERGNQPFNSKFLPNSSTNTLFTDNCLSPQVNLTVFSLSFSKTLRLQLVQIIASTRTNRNTILFYFRTKHKALQSRHGWHSLWFGKKSARRAIHQVQLIPDEFDSFFAPLIQSFFGR